MLATVAALAGGGGGTGRRQEGALEAGGRAVGRYLLSASALCLGPLEAEANRRSQSKVRQSSSCRVDEEKLQSWRTFNIQYSTVECPPISNGPGKAEGTATFTSNHWQTKFFISAPVNPARPPELPTTDDGPWKAYSTQIDYRATQGLFVGWERCVYAGSAFSKISK